MFYQKYLLYFTVFFVLTAIILPFIFLKDVYPFHRFGMFAEPVKHQSQQEKFYVFYKIDNQDFVKEDNTNFVELKPQDIPLNSNAFEMQLRKHHYQNKHADFINVFDIIINKKMNLSKKENIKWKWYHVIRNQGMNAKVDSICVFSN